MKRGAFVAAAAAVVALPALPTGLLPQKAGVQAWDVVLATARAGCDFDFWVGPSGLCHFADPVRKLSFACTLEDLPGVVAAAINASDWPITASRGAALLK